MTDTVMCGSFAQCVERQLDDLLVQSIHAFSAIYLVLFSVAGCILDL